MPRGWRLILISLALSATTSPVSSQNEKPQTVAARHLVAIDPGHGGSDAGAIGVRSSILEKNLVLDLALQLGKLLQAESDIAVAYTRNSDIDLSLLHRTEIANHSQGTLLISLHAGSSSNPASHGPRVFYLPAPQPKAGSVTGTAVGDRGMGSKIPATSRPLSLRLIPWERAHEPYDAASAGLAACIQGSLNTLYGMQHEIRAIPLYLAKGAQMPAVLVEVGYLTHEEEDERLQKLEFRHDLVAALGRGIIDYISRLQGTDRSEK